MQMSVTESARSYFLNISRWKLHSKFSSKRWLKITPHVEFSYRLDILPSQRQLSGHPGDILLRLYSVMSSWWSLFYHFSLVECNGLTTFLNSSQNGSISSFGYYHYYRYNQSCSWLITAPIDQRVLIYFTRFDLRGCYNCDCNSVTINDGRASWSPRLARLCGKNPPGLVYYSLGEYLRITFEPKGSEYVYQEFQVQYRTLFHHSSSKFLTKISLWWHLNLKGPTLSF